MQVLAADREAPQRRKKCATMGLGPGGRLSQAGPANESKTQRSRRRSAPQAGARERAEPEPTAPILANLGAVANAWKETGGRQTHAFLN
jgi:hypothetical protein